jgi:acetyl esterase/lipase
MKAILISLFLLTTIMSVKAQYQTIPLWESVPPGNKNVQTEEQRTISGSDAKILTKVTTPELWWFQSKKEGACPAIIICPGGGYGVEAYEHEGTQVAEWLASQGFNAFVLKYRLPDETLFEQATFIPLADVRQAFLVVRNKASELKTDPNRVGVMGFSAGGHLAASAATLFDTEIPFVQSGQKVRPDFSVLLYPVISMRDSLTHKGSRKALLGENPTESMIKTFSLEEQVTPGTPPTFILHATDDPAVNIGNTLCYTEALKKNNVPVKQILLPEGGHGFGFRKESPAFIWTHHLSEWLQEPTTDK